MGEKLKTEDSPLVSCQVCLKEVPRSVAKSLEGADYVYHFCGADCYQRWQKNSGAEERKPPAKG